MKILLAKNDRSEIVDKLKKFSRRLSHQIAFLLKKHYNEITIENDLFFDREKNIKKKKLKLKMNLKKISKNLARLLKILIINS